MEHRGHHARLDGGQFLMDRDNEGQQEETPRGVSAWGVVAATTPRAILDERYPQPKHRDVSPNTRISDSPTCVRSSTRFRRLCPKVGIAKARAAPALPVGSGRTAPSRPRLPPPHELVSYAEQGAHRLEGCPRGAWTLGHGKPGCTVLVLCPGRVPGHA